MPSCDKFRLGVFASCSLKIGGRVFALVVHPRQAAVETKKPSFDGGFQGVIVTMSGLVVFSVCGRLSEPSRSPT